MQQKSGAHGTIRVRRWGHGGMCFLRMNFRMLHTFSRASAPCPFIGGVSGQDKMSDLSLQLQQATSQFPVSSYFSEALFQRELDTIFAHGPRYVGHAAAVPNVGDYYALPQENEGLRWYTRPTASS